MAGETRRGFLKAAPGAAAAAAATPAEAKEKKGRAKGYRGSGFAPGGAPRKLSENLWVFEDTCNVYVIREGSSAVLVDFGSGKVLDHLKELGISKVDWVLHTHHHRDQCQGDKLAVARGIPIAAPAHEKHLFDDAENFWRNRRVFNLYYMRNDFHTLTESVPVEKALVDYSTFRAGKTEFFVMPSPGHTLGSITLIATVDGKRVAFSGDLMHSAGKIQNLYDTQVNYGGSEGIDLGIFSLARLREQRPAMLCPSHGEVIPDPDTAMAQTMERLTDYYRFQTGNRPCEAFRPFPVSRHLVAHDLTNSSFYAIISDSGKALFIDYGTISSQAFNVFERATATTDRMRFVEHNIAELKRTYGLKSVDVAMPSHIHDDHMNGFPHLIRTYATKVWCLDNMVDIFENPRGINSGCVVPEAFKVSRAFAPGERFRWEEFDFEITHSPGHTEYQMALHTVIDGQKVAVTGGAFFPNPMQDGTLRHNLIFRNHVENDSHLKSVQGLIEREPQLICPGHGRPYPVDRGLLLATEQKMRRQQQFFFDLLPEGETDFGLDPSWVSIYPYQMLVKAGSRQRAEIRVQNYRARAMKMEVALVAPAEWKVEPATLRFEVPARGKTKQAFEVTIPRDWTPPGPRFAIAADVMADGRYLGQITEAVVEV